MNLGEIIRELTSINNSRDLTKMRASAQKLLNFFQKKMKDSSQVSGNIQIPTKSEGDRMLNAAAIEEVMDLSIIPTDTPKGQQLLQAIKALLDYTKSLEQ